MAAVPQSNAVEEVIKKLKKSNIPRPDPSVLLVISKSNNLLQYCNAQTDYAVDLYRELKGAPTTNTKNFLSHELQMTINGSCVKDKPMLLSARNRDGIKMVKLLRHTLPNLSVSENQEEGSMEREAVHLLQLESTNLAFLRMKIERVRVPDNLPGVGTGGLIDVLIMDKCSGTLDDTPPFTFMVDILTDQAVRVLEAVKFMHSLGLVHNDIKYGNIFVVDNVWYLGDFGSMKKVGQPVTSTTFAYYRSNIIHQPAHPRVDYYMLLVVLLKQTLPEVKLAETMFYDELGTHINHDMMMLYVQQFKNDKLGAEEYAPFLALLTDIMVLAELV
jgi:serine/threonine protein kinase